MEINYLELFSGIKKLVENQVSLPQPGHTSLWDAKSTLIKRQLYTISVYRGSRNQEKYSFHAMTRDTKIGLLRLDIGDTSVHKNPDGTIIKGPHLHIYIKGSELSEAFEFDIKNKNLIDCCLDFLFKFNIIDVTSDTIFAWEDIFSERHDSKLIILVNDENKVDSEAIEGMKNYGINTLFWSKIDENISLVK